IHSPDDYRHLTLINTVPSVARELLATNAIPPNARTMNLAGEALSPELVRDLHAHPVITTLHNLYGPSEDTTYSTHATTDPHHHRTPIGRPVDGTRAHVLDTSLRPVPVGSVGELYLEGLGITRGYHDRPALTAERYLPNPHGPGRLYRTGDLARWRTDGHLDYLGRTDDQVKIRGHRIEPGEIETVLKAHPTVTDAVVTTTGERLVAHVVGPVDLDDLVAHARTSLPDHMVPTHVVPLDELPLTPNGKIDRKALPAPVITGDDRVGPRTPAERIVADLWRELLDVPSAGVHDNFFSVGGHSILATRLAHRLTAVLGAAIPLRLVFDHPTIAELAANLPAHGTLTPIPTVPRTPAEDGTVTLPASAGQQRLWFLCRLDPTANLAYHITGSARIDGPLDVPALHAALRATAQRHEALRTTLREVDGEVVQVVHPTWEPGWTSGAVDLERGPLFRARVRRTGPEEHVLDLSVHHAVADGWSLTVLLREIADRYRAPEADAPPPVQYGDVVRWQRGTATADLDHWADVLAGAAPLDLPTDRPRPAHQTHNGAAVPVVLPGATVDRLARTTDTTAFTVVTTALTVLLAKLAGQHDVTIGIPVSGRTHPDTTDVIGFLVNSLPLRRRTTAGTTLAEALRDTHADLAETHSRSDTPFELLVQHLRPERERGRSPLFQVMLALNVEPPNTLDIPGLRFTRIDEPPAGTQFDLSLHLEQTPNAVSGHLTYNTDLFDGSTARLLAERLSGVVEVLATAPETTLAELDVRTDAERALLTALDTGHPAGTPTACVHELVEAQVDRTPDAVAVRAIDDTLTYRELDSRANRLAHHLIGLGTGPGDLVGVCLPRTSKLIVTILGVLKAGAAYVPIDPAYPAERVRFIVEDAKASCVITEDSVTPSDVDTRPAAAVRTDDLAYTIYTSGSTGRPKGVMIEHRQTAAMLAWATRVFPPEVLAETLAATSVCFDLSVYEVFAPLVSGGAVTVAPHDALDLIHSPGDYRHLTLINTVPSVARELLATNAIPPNARTMNLAGEALSPELVRDLHGHPTIRTLHNLYGPSEDTTYSTHAVTDPTHHRTPIGRPVDGTRAHVLDATLRPVPIGSVGELYLEGLGITRGYHDRPALTAERYLPNPHGPGRLYRTGDLARWRTDGHLDYLGRTDNQVKIRGHRVEPGEIETALRQQDSIADAVVTVKDDLLVAYVVGTPDTAALRTRLPHHLIPDRVVTLDALPLTPNGKVDRRALPEPRSASPATRVPPSTPEEHLVATIWADLLGRQDLGVHEDFFTVGGHSLLATRLTHRLTTALGATVPLRLVFDHPTIAELARALPTAATAPEPVPLLTRTPSADGTVVLPASAAQQRLWFLCRLDPRANLAYHITGAAEIDGPLDTGVLRAALHATAGRHETLRTSLREVDEEVVQVVSPDPAVPMTEVSTPDWSGVVAAESARPFDLATGPLVRAVVVRTAPDRHVLLLSLHHVISDGWSVDVLLREVTDHYGRLTTDPASQAPPPSAVQYADFAAWRREPGDLGFWRDRLADATALDLPTDRPRPAHQTHGGATVPLALPARGIGGTTTFTTLATALGVLLTKLSGQSAVTIGTPTAGRHHPDSTDLIGLLVNTLPLHLRTTPTATLASTLEATHAAVLDLHGHEVPFELLVRELEPTRDQSRSPLFQVMLAVNSTPPTYRMPGVVVRPVPVPQVATQFDLVLQVEERPDAVTGSLVYNTDLFDRSTAALFAERLAVVLDALATSPDTTLDDLDVRTDAERALLTALDTGHPAGTPTACVHQLVEAQVDRTPDAVALRCADSVLSYRELDARANRLAHHLIGLGIGPGDLVGVCLPRTSELVVAILGVLKAGAAYVPVDPAYPAERVRFIVEDTNAPLLLTTDTYALSDVDDRPEPTARPDDLAYTIYTSGSTGRPKGVMIEHRQTAAMLAWAVRVFPANVLAETLAATSV
ncbi:amino acid adenylation domain-containing protein, partial [Umezawaea sp.]|uniref:amino acid adenylation domain-containing protein n=1 Tax=Umezawaea sp. TaxID=1955258 RepID=UPI002ED131EF